jgi:hypothetical protein
METARPLAASLVGRGRPGSMSTSSTEERSIRSYITLNLRFAWNLGFGNWDLEFRARN